MSCLTTECLLTARGKKTSAFFPSSDFTLQYYPMLARDVKEIFFWTSFYFQDPFRWGAHNGSYSFLADLVVYFL